MKGLGVLSVFILLVVLALPLQGQDVQFGGRFLSADFGNELQFSPTDPDITFPAGFGAFVLWPYSDYLLLGLDAKVAKVQNAETELLAPMNGKVVFNAGALARIQRVPRGYFFKPYFQAGLGIMHINENSEWRPAVNVGLGLDFELNHGLALSFGAGYNRELARNRYYIDYGVGLTIAVNRDRSPASLVMKSTEDDLDGDGILNESDACPEAPGGLATLGCPDQDEDGIPDKDDACPDQAGLIGNGGCPVIDDRVMDEDIDYRGEEVSDTSEVLELDDRVMDEGIDLRPPTEGVDTISADTSKKEVLSKDEEIESPVYEKGDTVILEVLPASPDTDGDGIPDRIDECPEVFGNAELMGCPEPDSDNDGVSDDEDKCPDVAGSIYNQGCPEGYLIQIDSLFGGDDDETERDSVKVMIPDHAPEVLDSLEIQKDTSDATLIKERTKEEAEDEEEDDVAAPSDTDDFKDSDGDGIADRIDPCPDQPGTLESKGCPESREEEVDEQEEGSSQGTLSSESDFEFSPVINFETGIATLGRSYLPVLDDVVAFMNNNPEYSLGIYGHTDATGSSFVNDILSKRRAEACWTYLKHKGISEERMTFHGEGEYTPISDNETAEGRFKNRRVVFKFRK